MTDEIVMKKGDTKPIRNLVLQEKNTSGSKVPVDLTGSTVEFHVYDEDSDEMIIDGSPATIEDAGNGEVSYSWEESDTQQSGVYQGEFVVIYADGELTFPNDGYISVTINEDAQGGLN